MHCALSTQVVPLLRFYEDYNLGTADENTLKKLLDRKYTQTLVGWAGESIAKLAKATKDKVGKFPTSRGGGNNFLHGLVE